jgi:hypothetical protein
MSDKKTFEIYYFKKIPYLTNIIISLLLISVIVFVFFYTGISSKRSTPEMKTFYLINTSTVKLLYWSAFSTVFFFILLLLAKLKRKGLIIFYPESIELILKNEKMFLPISEIKRVYCNDSEDKEGKPNKYFSLTINTWKNKNIKVRLRNTADMNSFTDKLLSYKDNLKIDYFYSKWVVPD